MWKRPATTSTPSSSSLSSPQQNRGHLDDADDKRPAAKRGSDTSRRLQPMMSSLSTMSLRDLFFMAVGMMFSSFVFRQQQLENGTRGGTTVTTNNSDGPVIAAYNALQEEGWHPIHVFYGKMNHITDEIPAEYRVDSIEKNAKGTHWFSQHGQDEAVVDFFQGKKNGYFVDLAANDAIWASNTFALEQNYGWNGLCIEPNPHYWFRLSFRRCHAIGAMVGKTTMEEVGAKFSNGPYGGIVRKDFDNAKLREAEIQRYTASLADIFKAFDTPKVIDYMSLDVEGAEEFIMSGFPFDEYTFLTLSIERPKEGFKALLEEKGYKFVKDFKHGDTFWAHESVYKDGTATSSTANENKD